MDNKEIIGCLYYGITCILSNIRAVNVYFVCIGLLLVENEPVLVIFHSHF